MKPSLLYKDYLLENTAEFKWSDKQMDAACGILFEIAKANGAEILEDVDVPKENKQRFIISRTQDAVQRRLNGYASSVVQQIPDFVYSQAIDKQKNALTTLHQWKPKLDINKALFDELEALPEIGKVLAQRILEYRNLHGAFKTVEQLKDVKGIDEAITEKLKDIIFVMPGEFRAQFLSPQLLKFVSNPSLITYAKLLLSGGGFSTETGQDDSPPDRLIAELASIHNELLQNKFFTHKHLPMTRGSRVRELAKIEKKANELETNAVTGDNSFTGFLFDESYATFVKELLRSATKSIKIVMFYMRYDKAGQNTLSDQLVEETLVAKQRGVEVQVILDRDREGDVFKSRLINHNAFEVLKNANIEVVFDEIGRANHSKLVLVDDEHVVVGSHNWTKGSLQEYDDTSIYVASKPLAEKYLKHFKNRFEQLKTA